MADVPSEQEILAVLNGLADGFNNTIGLKFVSASPDRIEATVEVTRALLQPYGLVHGGVYATIVESLASTGAALWATRHGRNVVGLDNATSFFKAVRSGTLHATATPLTRGRTTQVWEVAIHDDEGRLAASGRTRLLCTDPSHNVAGEQLEVQFTGD